MTLCFGGYCTFALPSDPEHTLKINQFLSMKLKFNKMECVFYKFVAIISMFMKTHNFIMCLLIWILLMFIQKRTLILPKCGLVIQMTPSHALLAFSTVALPLYWFALLQLVSLFSTKEGISVTILKPAKTFPILRDRLTQLHRTLYETESAHFRPLFHPIKGAE